MGWMFLNLRILQSHWGKCLETVLRDTTRMSQRSRFEGGNKMRRQKRCKLKIDAAGCVCFCA